MSTGNSKVAIIGAGFVGASTAFTLSLKRMVNELVLIDVSKEKAIGEAMDINHSLPFIGQMSVYAGDYEDCADCDVIVITAGTNRKPGETRLDLAKRNVSIAKEITANIMKHYTRGVILVVSNPVDILTYKIQEWSGLPKEKVIGTGTTLDSARFRYLLSEKLNIDVRNIHGYIIGEHGDSQIPAWSVTHVSGKKISDYFCMPSYCLTEQDKIDIVENVKNAGAEVIQKKGATYYAIALTTTTIIEAILKNQNTIRTVTSVIDGMYGIKDVAISLPSVLSATGITGIVELDLSLEEQSALMKSARQVRAILDELEEI